MRRFFDTLLVIVLVSVSMLCTVIAVLFPARGVRLLFRRLAELFNRLANKV